jgi:pilus assembly protein Flp/PilA
MLSPAVSSPARDDLTRGASSAVASATRSGPKVNVEALWRRRKTYMQPIEQLLQNEEGATAIEYGLIAALIALACIIAFTSLGLNLANIFNTISEALRG